MNSAKIPDTPRYPFRMYGRIVEAYRFKATSTTGEVSYYTNQKEAASFGGIVDPFDNTFMWMDGIEVEDVPDTFSEAVKIYEMGQDAYQRKKAFDTAKDTEKLRADLDYVMLMGGLS